MVGQSLSAGRAGTIGRNDGARPSSSAGTRDELTIDRHGQLVEEMADATLDLVADRSDLVDGPAGGILQLPLLVALPGKDRAGVAAAHRDDDVGRGLRPAGPGDGSITCQGTQGKSFSI